METKGKGKAIIGIAMAAIILASVFAVMVPMGSAGTGDKNEIVPDKQGVQVIIGQILSFSGDDHLKSIIGISPDDVEDLIIGTATDDFDSTLFPQAGTYFVDQDGDAAKDDNETSVSVIELTFELKLVSPGTTNEITSTTEGKEVEIKLTTNIPDAANGTIKLRWVDGDQEITVDGAGNPLEGLEMSAIKGFTINTADFDKGEYEVYIKTDKNEADGLDESTDTVEFTIYKEEIVLEADNEEPTIDEDVKFTVQAPPETLITIESDEPGVSTMKIGRGDIPAGTYVWDGDVFKHDTYDPKTDENGKFVFFMEFTDDKKVTITVKNGTMVIDGEVDIDVKELVAELDVPRTVVIGKDIEIEGTSNTGEEVDIYIEGQLVAAKVDIDDGEFSKDIKTGTDADIDDLKMEGSVKVEIVVDGPGNVGDIDDLPDEYDVADTAVVRLVSGELTAEQADDVLTTDDEDYTILGTAEGVGDIDVLIFGPKGGSQILTAEGDGFESVDVEDDDSFEDDIITTDEDTDTGTYTTVIVSVGRDGVYGDGELEPGDLVVEYKDDFTGKTASQILSILASDLWDAPGSDDLFFILSFKIENAWLAFDPIEAVAVGEPINATGTTNRADGTDVLVTIEGPSDLLPDSVDVEDGTFSVSIDTEGAKEGTYTLEADDGDGNTDTITVVIGEAAPEPTPTVEPTVEPTATAIPTAVPTAEPAAEPAAEPTATPEEPGFEAVFAIAGLLAIAYLVLRRRK